MATACEVNSRHMVTTKVTLIRETNGHSISAVKFNPQYPKQLALGFDSGRVEIRDGRETVFGQIGYLYTGGLDWRPAGDLLTAGFEDGSVRHWDPRCRNDDPIAISRSYKSRITGLTWNQTGDMVATGSTDDGVSIWDLRARKELPFM